MGLLSKWIESLDYQYEILSSCTRHRSPHSTCEKCIAACEEQALSIVNGKPVFDHDKCEQCGSCMAACPVQAIAGILPKRNIIQNQLVISNQSIPTSKELLILYSKGIKSIICEEEAFIQSWQQPIEEANQMLRQLGESPFSVSMKAVKSVKEEECCSRRELFSLLRNESKSLMKQITPAKWRFNQNALDLAKYYPNYQFAKITINIEKCTLCSVCQRLCEKNCFTIQEGHFSLLSQGCSSCQLCVAACPEKAILIEDEISKSEEVALPIYGKVCRACDQPFKTLRKHDDKCVACTKLKSSYSL